MEYLFFLNNNTTNSYAILKYKQNKLSSLILLKQFILSNLFEFLKIIFFI